MIELQIVRTRHPPELFVGQMAEIMQASGFPSSRDRIKERLEQLPREDRILLAIDGDRLLGYAHLTVAHGLLTDDTAEVVSLIVHPEVRRQGVGRHLIAAAETWALQSGRARLLMRTEVVRSDAHAFYIALGYEESATTLEFVRDLARKRRADAPTQILKS
jgi:GNAT superfamily N-acetyltransferase